MSKWIVALIAAALLGSGLLLWRHHDTQQDHQQAAQKQEHPAPVPVRVMVAEAQDTPVYVTGIGNVAALNQVVIHSQIDGQLVRVNFTEGQNVRAGDVLAEIDSRAIRADLARAEAQKASAVAQLSNAQLNVKRYDNLLKDDAIARQTVDAARSNAEQLQAAVQVAQAAIATAQVQLSYTVIKAPMAGYVGISNIDPGNIVHAGDATGLVTITQITPISIFFTLPQTALGDVLPLMRQKDKPIDIFAKEGETLLGHGQLQAIDSQIDATTGTVRLKAVSPNNPQSLWPGQFVVVRLQTRTLKNKIVLPLTAVQRTQDKVFVYRVKPDDTAEQVDVKVLLEDKDKIVIDGVQPGDQLVIDGQSRIKPNGAVKIVTDADANQGDAKESAKDDGKDQADDKTKDHKDKKSDAARAVP